LEITNTNFSISFFSLDENFVTIQLFFDRINPAYSGNMIAFHPVDFLVKNFFYNESKKARRLQNS